MINFIRTSIKGRILGLFLLTSAAVTAGCTAQAETSQRIEPPKREVTTARRAPVDDDVRMTRNPYAEMPQDGDFDYSAPPKSAPVKLTKSTFEQIKTGMTLSEVEKLMGDKGMLVSTMDVNGRKTQIYKWSNDNFTTYIDVTIENEKVVEKKDKGLK